MRSFLQLEHHQNEELPEPFRSDDVRYPAELVRVFLDEYTRPGDTVLDPFAGFGTTLLAAEGMGRQGYGVELDAAKVDYVRSRMSHPQRLRQGDARRLASIGLPTCEFCMTSPPFMNLDEENDPLSDYTRGGRGYPAYLRELGEIFAQVQQLLKPGGRVVVEVANLKMYGRITTLAWDVAQRVSQVLHFEGEVVIGWDHYRYGYDHSYCLVYSAI